MKIQLRHRYEDIISLENLLLAWQEFIVGKKSKTDVQIFASDLINNIVTLHKDLVNKIYLHGGYEQFTVADPKLRLIHKASVRDRLLHHAVYRILYPFFDRTFIADSYSCRLGKGTHKAINRFKRLVNHASQNNTRTCWILKGDIKKFFASIDHTILLSILKEYISDPDIIWLLQNIICSFETSFGTDVGLPLGNLTSQLFANVYMNVFDQFVKHTLRARHYVRYADDFVFISADKLCLQKTVPMITQFLKGSLKLTMHPNKIFLKTIASGIDFLGWVNFPKHRILRGTTKRRMMKRTEIHPTEETLASYQGLMKHGNTYKLMKKVLNNYWLWRSVN